jgi:hypothetical protein
MALSSSARRAQTVTAMLERVTLDGGICHGFDRPAAVFRGCGWDACERV